MAIGDEKLKVAYLRTIYCRLVNLSDDAGGKREPNITSYAVGTTDTILCSMRPAGGDAGASTRRVNFSDYRHWCGFRNGIISEVTSMTPTMLVLNRH